MITEISQLKISDEMREFLELLKEYLQNEFELLNKLDELEGAINQQGIILDKLFRLLGINIGAIALQPEEYKDVSDTDKVFTRKNPGIK